MKVPSPPDQTSFLLVLAGTSVLWWLYIDHRLYGNYTTNQVTEEAELNRENGQALLVYAGAATAFTVRVYSLFPTQRGHLFILERNLRIK